MKRIVFLDYVRVFACFLVMVVHASENFYGAEGSTDILPSALYSHLTAVFHIYDTIQHFTLAVGADRCRDIIERYIENILELSFTGRTFVVHVPFDQPLFIYTRNIAMVE